MTQNISQIEKVSEAIEAAITECGIRSIAKLPKFMQAIRMAQGIAAMRTALSDDFVRGTLMPLMGTTLGFLTDLDHDKDGRRYGINVVRDCAIEAMLRGFNVVGNEFNVIAGRFYGTRAGFERQVLEFPGLANLVLQPGVPHLVADKGALVPFSASWTLHGEAMRIECQQTKDGMDLRIPVKVNSGMGPDAIIGKATRKMLYRIWSRINGASYGLVDGEIGDEPLVTTGEPAPSLPAPSPVPAGTPEGKRIKLGRGKAVAPRETEGAAAAAPAPAPRPLQPTPAAAVPASPPASSSTVKLPGGDGSAPVDLVELHETLAQVDDRWAGPGRRAMLERWTEPERLTALLWAQLVLDDGPLELQSKRPPHTVLERQPGED